MQSLADPRSENILSKGISRARQTILSPLLAIAFLSQANANNTLVSDPANSPVNDFAAGFIDSEHFLITFTAKHAGVYTVLRSSDLENYTPVAVRNLNPGQAAIITRLRSIDGQRAFYRIQLITADTTTSSDL